MSSTPMSSCSAPARPGSVRPTASRGAGRRVIVLEREPHVGGLAASFEVAGQRVDHGSHRLHPSTPAPIMATLRELLGTDLQRRPRNGRIRLAGRFVAFPPRPADLVRKLPPALSVRLARDMATSPFRKDARPTRSPRRVRGSLGPTMSDRFYAPYVEKLFGVPADRARGGARATAHRCELGVGVGAARRAARSRPGRVLLPAPGLRTDPGGDRVGRGSRRRGHPHRDRGCRGRTWEPITSRCALQTARPSPRRWCGRRVPLALLARLAVGAGARARGGIAARIARDGARLPRAPDARSGRRSTRTTSPSATCCSAGSRNRRTTATATRIPQT